MKRQTILVLMLVAVVAMIIIFIVSEKDKPKSDSEFSLSVTSTAPDGQPDSGNDETDVKSAEAGSEQIQTGVQTDVEGSDGADNETEQDPEKQPDTDSDTADPNTESGGEGPKGMMPGGERTNRRSFFGSGRMGGESSGRRPDENKAEAGQGSEEDLCSINLNNVQMKEIIQILGEWTSKPVIPTSDEVLQTRVTIYSTQKLPRQKALSMLYAALRAKGVVAEISEDKIFLKPASQARLGTVPTLGPDEPLAAVEDRSVIVEKFFKLGNYNVTKLAKMIAAVADEYGHVTALEDTNTLVVIDTVENLMRIERVITQLDVPESEQTVEKLFVIKNADPLEIVQVLELILGQSQQSRSGYRPRGPSPQPQPKKGESQKTASTVVIESTQVEMKLIPMPKQKWIIARASADDMKVIASWIEKLDTSEDVKQEQSVIQVKYADASEIVDIVNRTLKNMPGAELRTSVVVEALPQTQQIVVFGSQENRKSIERIIAEIDLPLDDTYKEQTFDIKHADPDQIKENIDVLYGESVPTYDMYSYYRYGPGSKSNRKDVVKVISYPTTSTITVIASEENMVKIAAQVAEWDSPIDIDREHYRIISVQNSDPVKLVELLQELFSEEGSNSGNDFMSMIFGGRRGGSSSSATSRKKIVGSLYGMLTFQPVPDTKKIVVISKLPEAYDVIEQLVEKLDSQEMAEVPKVIKLDYADPEDLSERLNAIFNEQGQNATITLKEEGLSPYSMNSEGDSSSSNSNNNQQTSNTAQYKPPWNQGRSQTDQMPISNVIGRIRFIPVPASKAILVLAPPEFMGNISAMIEELDEPGKQVMIKAIIVEVDHAKATSIGVELSSNAAAFGTLEENVVTALTSITQQENPGNMTLNASVNVTTLVDFLVRNTDAKVLNQQTLWTKDNEEASFFKGDEIAFIGNATISTTSTQKTTNYEYKKVGMTLRTRPNITPMNKVDMEINLIISQLTSKLINSQPVSTYVDTTTNAIVNNGDTILLGGILFQKDSTIRSKVPLLGDLPILGGLFSHDHSELSNNELLVFITPYVVDIDTETSEIEPMQQQKKTMEQVVQEFKNINSKIEKGTKK